jgi:hypothetical protein
MYFGDHDPSHFHAEYAAKLKNLEATGKIAPLP